MQQLNEMYMSPSQQEVVMTLSADNKQAFDVARFYDNEGEAVMRLTIADCIHIYMPEVQMFQYLMSAIGMNWWEQTDITISSPHPFDLEDVDV